VQQFRRVGVVHVFAGDEADTGVDAPLDRLAADVRHHGLHAEIAHVDRILQHETVDMRVAQSLDQAVRGIEPDELHFSCPAVVLEQPSALPATSTRSA